MSHTLNPNSFFPVPPPQAREAHPNAFHTTYHHACPAARPERTTYYEEPAHQHTARPQRAWMRDHKRYESSDHRGGHQSSGHQHYRGHPWRKDPRKEDGAYHLPSLHAQDGGYAQGSNAVDSRQEDDDIYLARLNALRSFGRFILKTVGWFVKTIAFVAIMSFAVGCGAAAGVVLLMVGKPLVDWLTVSAVMGSSLSDLEDSLSASDDSADTRASPSFALPPLHVARAGAVAGAMAFLVPGLLFFLTEVTFAGSHLFTKPRRWVESLLRHTLFRGSPRGVFRPDPRGVSSPDPRGELRRDPRGVSSRSPRGVFRHSSPPVYANDFARDERMDFVINAVVYVLATLCFAVGVGVWVVILPPGLNNSSLPGSEDEATKNSSTSGQGIETTSDQGIEVTFASAIQTSLLGWAVIHVGFAGVLALVMAVKTVPRWSMERVGM